MRNKTVSNSKGLAGWLDDFIVGLGKKEASAEVNNIENEEELVADIDSEEESIETMATININDLEKIVWNDETFRVHFDENGANVINEFGNSVTFLKGLKTIEEVDHALNSKQVVTSSDDIQEEEVITAEESDSEFEEALTAAIDSIPTEEDQEVVANEEEMIEDITGEEDLGEELVASNKEDVFEAIVAGFEELEKRLATVEQMYARNPQFTQDEMATQVQQEEAKHFTETADETQKQISNEQNHDLTTPAGRVEVSNTSQPSEIEQMVTEDITEDTNEKEVEDIKDTEEPTQEEQVTDENTEDSNENVEDNMEKLTGKDEKIFQNGICPETGEELVKSKTAGMFQGIYSPKGGTEYAVNLNTGEIFRYKG